MIPRGKNALGKWLNGEEINRRQAMEAKCYECMSGYVDGVEDCKCQNCPLHAWMPYKPRKVTGAKGRIDSNLARGIENGLETEKCSCSGTSDCHECESAKKVGGKKVI